MKQIHKIQNIPLSCLSQDTRTRGIGRVLLCLFPTAVFFIVLIPLTVRSVLMEHGHSSLMKTVRTQAAEMDRYLRNHDVLGAVRTLGTAGANIRRILQDQETPDDNALSEELQHVCRQCEASLIYIMDTEGVVVACTPYGPGNTQTLRGNNYRFHPYFTEALQGHDGVYPALVATTSKRGIYYASPVYSIRPQESPNEILGAVVIKMPLDRVDSILAGMEYPSALVSPEGIVFSASNPDWIFKKAFFSFSLIPPKQPDASSSDTITDFRHPEPLAFDLNQTRLILQGREHIVARMDLNLADETGRWKLIALAPTASFYSGQTLWYSAVAVLLLHILVALIWTARLKTGQALRALREREQWYRVLFESSDNAVFIMSQGKFIECNERTLVIFGCTREQIVGQGPERFSPAFQPNGIPTPEMTAPYLARATKGEKLRFEWRHCRLDGTEFDTEVTLTRLDLSGQIFLQATVRDITDRKQMERIQFEHHRRLSQIVEASPVPTLVLDKNHHVTHWNKALVNLTGMDAPRIVGTDRYWEAFYRKPRPILADLILDQTGQEAFLAYYGETLRASSVTQGAYEAEAFFPDMKPNGRWLFFTAAPLQDMQGQVIGAIEVLQDITDRKHYEEALCRTKEDAAEAWAQTEMVNRKLELAAEQAKLMANEAIQASKSKSEFLANMSHEIRTPMNAIIGFSDVLIEEGLTDEQKQYVEMIRSSGRHLLGLINDILDFSKIEAGKLETEIIDCSPVDLIEQVESFIRPSAEAKKLAFQVDLAEELPSLVRTDPARVRQCLVNLLTNAVKFTDQGHVALRVQLEHKQEALFLRFDVEDTGIGIEEEKLAEIFTAFSQADTSHTRRFGGTGLGLTITRQLAQLLGGSVTVQSQPKEGTLFTLRIPANIELHEHPLLRKSVSPDENPSSPETDVHFAGRVLVAEDNPANQMLIKALLNRLGLTITVAQDGAQVMELVRQHEYDIIFMDMQMPVMNGYEATRRLRQFGFAKPIVAVTANAMKGDDKKCLRAGCDHYLSKPMERDRLMEILREHLPQSGAALESEPYEAVCIQVE
ncbi:MAG: response regulator, partial [Sedimentisphaerales bacterium]|nr:response regulator [Sedimentisphaerales bacterium]